MKKLIYLSGIVSANLLLVGSLFKVFHWPGANLLLGLSILIFCFGFLPFALRSSYLNKPQTSSKWIYIVAFIVFAFCLMGALFKVLHWPGAGLLLLISVPLPFVLFLPVYLYQTRKAKNQSMVNNLGVFFGLTFLAVFSVMLTLNVGVGLLEGFALNSLNNEKNEKFNKEILNAVNYQSPIAYKADELCNYIDELKSDILVYANNDAADNKQTIANTNPLAIKNKGASITSIFNKVEGDGRSKVEVLKLKIDELQESIEKSEVASKELKELAKKLFYADFLPLEQDGMKEISSAEREFSTNQLVAVLDVLTRIKANVRFVEAEFELISQAKL
jgi:hypothetical protein